MGNSDTVPDPYTPPKLPLFSLPPPHHLEPSGISTPPLQATVASVPFRWEEQPGKPRPCTDIITTTTHPTKCLDLPPRLTTVVDPTTSKTASPSPTTVLHGPLSSSFRFVNERRRRERRQRSFDSNGDGGWSPNGDGDGDGEKVDRLLLLGEKVDRRGLFGSFRIKGKVTSSSASAVDVKGRKMRRNGSVSKVSGSHFWVKIYEGFKQVVPWRKKPKIECFTL